MPADKTAAERQRRHRAHERRGEVCFSFYAPHDALVTWLIEQELITYQDALDMGKVNAACAQVVRRLCVR